MPDWITGPNVLAAIAVGGVVYAGIRWIVLTTQDRSDFKEFMKRIDKDLNTIKGSVNRILGKLGELGPPLVEQGSPLRLTTYGQDLATEMGAWAWADQIAGDLAKKAAETGSEPYQIDQECEHYVHGPDLGAAMTAAVGRVAYERGVKPNDLLAALHIVLRDAVLKRVGDYL